MDPDTLLSFFNDYFDPTRYLIRMVLKCRKDVDLSIAEKQAQKTRGLMTRDK